MARRARDDRLVHAPLNRAMSTDNPRTRMRILHIVQNLNYGGMERLLFEMLRGSDRERFENVVLALQYIGRFGEGMSKYATVKLAAPTSRLSLLRPASLAREIAAISPDVVHSHSGIWYKASLAARMANVPWIVHTEHGRAFPDPWIARTMDGAASRRTDVIVGVSEAVGSALKLHVSRFPDRVCVIPNGVDTNSFQPQPDKGVLRRELGVSSDAPIIGSIGRLEPIKGYEVMVDAFAALRARAGADARPELVIAGDGSERRAMQERAERAGVADGIHWLGWRDDVHNLHSAFSIFTMSSHSEGTSISLLEAMSAALCPVVTDVGGNAAVLGSALRHRLVPRDNAAALAVAWEAALRDHAARAADARVARARVVSEFALSTTIRSYEGVYLRELPDVDRTA